jgi:thiosulfate reductase cytochrome b subunit
MVTIDRGHRRVLLHPAIIRITHWLNALAIIMMIASGWRIYNNDPIFPWLQFPIELTLGGDPEITYKLNGDAGFSNALLWHFAAMWLLVVNGLVYLGYGLISGRFRAKFLPISPSAALREIGDALRLRLTHDDISTYNAVQRLLYVGVVAVIMLVVLSGLAIWKPVQLQTLAALFGDFQGARLVHFLAMAAIVGFLVVHVALALIVPSTLVAMITGRARIPAPAIDASLPAE